MAKMVEMQHRCSIRGLRAIVKTQYIRSITTGSSLWLTNLIW